MERGKTSRRPLHGTAFEPVCQARHAVAIALFRNDSVNGRTQPARMFPSHQKLLSEEVISRWLSFPYRGKWLQMRISQLTLRTHPSHSTSIRGMRKLHSVCRSSSTGNACTEAQNESTANEVAHGVGRRLNCRSDDHKETANKDAHSPAITCIRSSRRQLSSHFEVFLLA